MNIQELKEKAMTNDPKALYEYGKYLFSQTDDLRKGWEMLLESGKLGCAEAQYYIGVIYETGTLDGMVKKSNEKSIQWLTKASENDYIKASVELIDIYESLNQNNKLKTLYEKVIPVYEKLAEENDKDALLFIGKLFYRGIVYPLDKEKALKVFEYGASLSEINCTLNCFVMYSNGEGTNVDLKKAKDYGDKLIHLLDQEYSDTEAISQLGNYVNAVATFYMENDEIFDVDKLEEYEKISYKHNYTDLALLLGQIYFYGAYNVTKNDKKSLEYLTKAAIRGNKQANELIGELFQNDNKSF